MNRSQAEALVRKRLRPELRDVLRVASELEGALRGIVERRGDEEPQQLAGVQSILAGRLADDLRAMQLLSLSGYAHQVASLGATAYEVAFIFAYLGEDASRAQSWLEHEDVTKLPWKRTDMVREATKFAFPTDPAAGSKQEVFYKFLCWYKHANPNALKRFAPSHNALSHALNSDPTFSSAHPDRVRLLLSLRAPLVAMISLLQRRLLTDAEAARVSCAARLYFAAENELIATERASGSNAAA